MNKRKLHTKIILIALVVLMVFAILFTVVAMIGSHAIFGEIEKLHQAEHARNLTFTKPSQTHNATLKNDATDSPFKVLQISDIHYVCSIFSKNQDRLALKAIADLVYATNPDLIVLTGDLVYPIFFNGSINNFISVEAVAKTFEAFGIPWTVIFGNHDAEFFSMMNLKQQCEFYNSQPHCLFFEGPADIEGLGNHVVELLNFDGSLNTALFLFDCNGYDGFYGHYDYIRDGQVNWYKNEVENLNSRENKKISSLVFVHIPLFEYRLAQEAVDNNDPDAVFLRGVVKESISSTTKTFGKMFDTMLQLGVTKAVFCGHDHVNNTAITYKGITLAYGMSIDYSAYAKRYSQDQHRGGQLIVVDKSQRVFISLVPQTDNYQPTQFFEVG